MPTDTDDAVMLVNLMTSLQRVEALPPLKLVGSISKMEYPRLFISLIALIACTKLLSASVNTDDPEAEGPKRIEAERKTSL